MSRSGWLVRGGDVLASAEIAETARERLRGLLGRDTVDGVLVIPGARSVHTVGMRFPIDVAWCDDENRVVRISTLRRWRVSGYVRSATSVVEAEAGSFSVWNVSVGDVLSVRTSDP